jgi:hypothetical protein
VARRGDPGDGLAALAAAGEAWWRQLAAWVTYRYLPAFAGAKAAEWPK